ncbi:uncharacterized protein LOC107022104 [Solanum pennellii]|uniref:Uncharacterized protein LOC107022104 n=1 Tax=Solanum pennellii TaxID=28526 RepID=A0ABM1GZS7_SOLPN|nr:uncharacterized protein LOC107022104 [Solanum pennellii]
MGCGGIYGHDPSDPSRTIIPPRRVNARNVNTRNANATPPVPNQEVSNAEFKNVIQMFAQSMIYQNNWVHANVNKNGGSVASRVRDFVRMNPPNFLGSQANEDPENFLDGSTRSLRNAMSLGDMNISSFMTHAHQVEGNKFREHAKEIKKARNRNYDYSQQKSGNGNCSSGQEKFSAPASSSASSGHRLRNCPSRQGQRGGNGRAQSTTSTTTASRPT